MSKVQTNYDISVIVPIYNIEEGFLRPCLDSLVNQTIKSIEVIMVDDGSTDDSGEIADEYAENYDNFVCYHIKNDGLGHARNFGAEKAHGKYIYFIDSDDAIALDVLERMFCAAERDGSDMAICAVERFNSSKEWGSYLHFLAFRDLESVTHIKENNALIYDTTAWNKLIRKDFWDKNNFSFPEHILYEDIPTTIPLHYLANQVSVIRTIGYKWRVRDMGTKSITQNTTDLTNLYDRIAILKMLDSFFEKNVKEESLILEKQIKALRFDLMIFVNVCLSVEKEQAEEIMKVVREYVLSSISREALSSVNLVEQKLYQALIDDDYERFIEIVSFRKKELKDCPYYEENGKVFAKLPKELFEEKCFDVTESVRKSLPVVIVNDVKSEKTKLTIRSTLFISKINVKDETEQEIKAFLLNEFTGEEIELETTPYKNTEITSNRGTSFSKLLDEKESYNYDGTGFVMTLDSETLPIKDDISSWIIILRYKNRFTKGTAVLKNLNDYNLKKVNGIACVSEKGIISIGVANGRSLSISLKRVENVLEKKKIDGNTLCFETSKSDSLFAINSITQDSVEFDKVGSNEFCIDKAALESDVEYGIFSKNENGDLFPLIRTNKAINIDSKGGAVFIVRSNKTHNVAIRTLERTTALNSFGRDGDILTLKTVSVGGKDFKAYKNARIVVDDAFTNQKVVLAKSKCKAEKNGAECIFNIDFSDPKIQENFYKSSREIFVEYTKKNKEIVRNRIFSKKYLKESFEYGSLGIIISRFSQGYLKMKLELIWSDEEASYKKRKALMSESYPKYREEPLNDKLILFESIWGTKYSCNPQAIYEYIDKYYPQYECVWSFKDPRTPIKGNARRVRRESLEYYKVLATAKYLVNNVNFEEDYVKREGQIEIQTMHGTPLKSLGLDVESDFKTIQQRDRFIEKCARWDHLIVQGKFVEDMAYQMYRFEKNILKTGYPRTDVLYLKKDVDSIKKAIGIPLDKKVILYAPTWRTRDSFDMQLDLEKARKELGDNYVLLIRLHHLCAKGYDVPADNEFIFDLTNYTDVQELYHISDMMITDYSSVMFDYALLNKPMMFFTYDLESYSEDTRGVYFDISKEAPGPLVFTTDELISAVKNIDEEIKKIEKRVSDFYDKYLTYECGESAKKVVEEVIKPSTPPAVPKKPKRGIFSFFSKK